MRSILFFAIIFIVGCGDAETVSDPPVCGDTRAEIAWLQSVDDLEQAGSDLTLSVATACRSIALAGGASTVWDGASPPTADDVGDACRRAVDVLSVLKAAGSFSVVMESPRRCEADLTMLAGCMAECLADPACVDQAASGCDPEELSVACAGTCAVGAVCDGMDSVAVQCAAACSGTCTGTTSGGCEGNCSGACEGVCSKQVAPGVCGGTCSSTCEGVCSAPATEAICSGSCTGVCEVTDGGLACPSGARCVGGCSGAATEPRCRGTVGYVCGDGGACSDPCRTTAQAGAWCTPARVRVRIGEGVDPGVVPTLEAALATLWTASQRCQDLANVPDVKSAIFIAGPSPYPGCESLRDRWVSAWVRVLDGCLNRSIEVIATGFGGT